MNIEVEVRLSHYVSNVEPYRGAHLEITDQASGSRIATVTLSPEQVYKLIANQSAKGGAEVLEPKHYKQKIGKEYVWERVELDEEFAKEIRAEHYPNEIMHDLGEFQKQKGGWQGYDWRLHNYGWSLRVWKYEGGDE